MNTNRLLSALMASSSCTVGSARSCRRWAYCAAAWKWMDPSVPAAFGSVSGDCRSAELSSLLRSWGGSVAHALQRRHQNGLARSA